MPTFEKGGNAKLSQVSSHLKSLKRAQNTRTMSTIFGSVNTETATSQSHDAPRWGDTCRYRFFHYSQPASRVVYGSMMVKTCELYQIVKDGCALAHRLFF